MKTLTCDEFEAFESGIDTEYFGISTAKAVLRKPCNTGDKQDQLLEFLHGFEFVIISNKSSDPINNRWIGEKTNAFLVDINIQLKKELSPVQNTDDLAVDSSSTISDQFPESKQIVQIAESSFKISQFLNDTYLPREKASGIYGDIVKNAFGKPGRFFVVTKKSGSVAGFLLFSMNKSISTSTIQLIAVNQDFTRQGIGQALIRSMENFVCSQGIAAVIVGTQFNNFSALKTYHSNGYTDFDCSSIYHYWPMKR